MDLHGSDVVEVCLLFWGQRGDGGSESCRQSLGPFSLENTELSEHFWKGKVVYTNEPPVRSNISLLKPDLVQARETYFKTYQPSCQSSL